jgi:hypothetical protein
MAPTRRNASESFVRRLSVSQSVSHSLRRKLELLRQCMGLLGIECQEACVAWTGWIIGDM